MDIKLFVATKAFIVYNGKVLILQESNKYTDGSNEGKFDVVGGRIVPGERFDESLLREIEEETGLEVKIGKPFFTSNPVSSSISLNKLSSNLSPGTILPPTTSNFPSLLPSVYLFDSWRIKTFPL